MSSAHVYLRLPEDWKWDQIPQEILVGKFSTGQTFFFGNSLTFQDCAQLTKANSIQGNKQDNITIIYTPWANLHKTNGMAVGQVGFKKANQVKKVHIPIRVNAIVNRLNKTKIEEYPNLQQERVEYDKEQKRLEIENRQRRLKEEKQVERERKQLKHQRDHAYDDLFNDENVRHSSNQDNEDAEDDFW